MHYNHCRRVTAHLQLNLLLLLLLLLLLNRLTVRGSACDCTVTSVVHGSVGVGLGYRLHCLGFKSQQGPETFRFVKRSIPTLGPTSPPLEWVPELLLGGKVTGA
jgi:hypothetical protein